MKKKGFRGVEHIRNIKEKPYKTLEEVCMEFAITIYPHIVKFYENEENEKAFQEWLKKRNKSSNSLE